MRRLMVAAFIAALSAACQQQTPVPTPTPEPAPRVIVPLSTPTPAPTSTPSEVIEQAMGRWLLDFRFDFTKGRFIEHTYFVLTIAVEVDAVGQISGRGEVGTMAEHHDCVARVLDGGDFWARLSGQLVEEDGRPVMVVQLKPEDVMLFQRYRRFCMGEDPIEYSSQLLWQGLRLAGITEFRIPAEHGARVKLAASFASPGVAALNGDVEITIAVRR